jgi:hypothetical protein
VALASDPCRTVNAFTEHVSVTVVTGVFLDHKDEEEAQRVVTSCAVLNSSDLIERLSFVHNATCLIALLSPNVKGLVYVGSINASDRRVWRFIFGKQSGKFLPRKGNPEVIPLDSGHVTDKAEQGEVGRFCRSLTKSIAVKVETFEFQGRSLEFEPTGQRFKFIGVRGWLDAIDFHLPNDNRRQRGCCCPNC